MITLSQIQAPIKQSLERFDGFVEEQFRADNPLLAQMMIDALSSRGKGVRPMLVLLCAALFPRVEQETQKREFIAAMMVEMIHLSSLIHDDVIDESLVRRGKPSMNAKWQSKRAVLAGDYILARNIAIGLQSGHVDLVQHVIGTIATLCEGEVLQDDCARRVAMTKEDYIDIISKKTASLLAASSSVGALAAGASGEEVQALQIFGFQLGLAFQIQDDILDYNPQANTGKANYQDAQEGKITLPLLLALEEVDSAEKDAVLLDLVNGKVQDVVAFVESKKGVDLARAYMMDYIAQAKEQLLCFAPGEVKEALLALCDFVAQRDK